LLTGRLPATRRARPKCGPRFSPGCAPPSTQPSHDHRTESVTIRAVRAQ
jgi:hypothetical protein